MRRSVVAVTLTLVATTGCRADWSERVTGTAIGTVGGAIAGGLLGSAVGSTTAGAVLGAVAGGAAGYIIGDYLADRRERACCPPSGSGGVAGSYSDPVPAPSFEPIPPSTDAIAASRTASVPSASRAAQAGAAYDAGRRATTPEEALRYYNEAMRLEPSRPEPHNARGLVLLYMDRR